MPEQKHTRPTRKTESAALAGAVATVLLYLLQQYVKNPIEPAVAAALTTIIVTLVAYVTRPRWEDGDLLDGE